LNRNLLLGWALLMSLFLIWTQYKTHQAKESLKLVEQQKADSLAQFNKTHPKVADTTSAASLTATPDSASSVPTSANDATTEPHRTIRVVTPHFTAMLDNQGARIAGLSIASLEGKPVYNPTLIRPEGEGALTLAINNKDLGPVVWKVDTQDTLIQLGSAPVTISFSTNVPGMGEVVRKYTFLTDKPAIRHETVLPNGVSSYALEWKGGLEETEKLASGRGFGLLSSYFSEVVYDNGVSVQRTSFQGEKTFNAESGVVRWLGMRRKYVAVLLDFHKEIQDRIVATGKGDPNQSTAPKHYSLRVAGTADDANALDFDVMVLPLQYANIKALGRNYEQILFSGWEWFFRADLWYVKLCGLVLRLLNTFHSWIPNYGIAIILLTLLVRFITLPLSISQTRQAAKMAQHQPEIKKIQEKYRGDRQKTQIEMMAYYKQQGINPLAPVMGCFPALLQMPVFISLFNVLGRAVELHEMPFFGWIRDLSQPDVVLYSFQVPFVFPVGLTILPFLMAGTMWVQMKMTLKDPNQKAMVWLMPIMMFLFSCSFPSGLVVYWTVSNLFTIAQTKIFTPKPSPIVGRIKTAKA
jgi:YidC/Oxa1 family membrane protein insertase